VSHSPVAAREFALEPADNRRLASLCGPLDANLRLVEARLGVQIRRRGHSFRIQGARAASSESVLRDLFAQTQHHEVTPQQVHLALVDQNGREHSNVEQTTAEHAHTKHARTGHAGAEHAGAEHAGTAHADAEHSSAELERDEDSVVRVPMAHDGADELHGRHAGRVHARREKVRARGSHQREYLANIRQHDLSFGIGPAGTGKTYLAVAVAVEALLDERVRRIVLVRPAVEAGERLGFLPGDMAQKVDPYLRPMYDALYEMMGYERVTRYMERNAIEVAPLAFMRGRSLNESFIILDEAQNSTIEQMKMFLTRIGFGSRAVVTGDLTQTDLPPGRMSGLHHAQLILRNVSGVAFTLFDAGDVVRHPLVQRIVQAYESHENLREP
jgi:phosphate starvation-inducible protein PhoH and related proteins